MKNVTGNRNIFSSPLKQKKKVSLHCLKSFFYTVLNHQQQHQDHHIILRCHVCIDHHIFNRTVKRKRKTS